MPSGKTSFTHIKDKKINIYKSVQYKVPGGDIEDKWEPVTDGKLWAHYRSLSGDQYYIAAQAGYKADAMFTINWREGIEPGMIVVFRGVVWSIRRVDDLEGYKKDLKLSCEMISQIDAGAYPGVVTD